jgi:uncharacterized delta-60 repeat protein
VGYRNVQDAKPTNKRRRVMMGQSIRVAMTGLTILGFAAGMNPASAAGNTAGTLDTTFGKGGATITDFTTSNSSSGVIPYSIALQGNGDILVLANVNIGVSTTTDVLRYTTGGVLDTTFGSQGIAVLPTTIGELDVMALQPNGQILVAGQLTSGANAGDFAVERLNTSGTADTSFGSDGLATAPALDSIPTGLVLLAETNGDILLGGGLFPTGRRQPSTTFFIRLTSAGRLDSSFGEAGTVNVIATGGCTALAELSTGEIQVVNVNKIAQFSPAGVQESAVTHGTIVASAGSQFPNTPSIFQPDGDFLVASPSFVGEESRGHNASTEVLRFTNTGAADSTFADPRFHFEGTGGPDIEALPSSIAVGPNGDIVVAGEQIAFGASGTSFNGLARLTANGDLDPTFGSGGTVANSISGSTTGYYDQVVIQPADSKIVVIGLTNDNTALTVSRYLGQ